MNFMFYMCEDDKMWEPYKHNRTDLTGLLDILKNVDLDCSFKKF